MFDDRLPARDETWRALPDEALGPLEERVLEGVWRTDTPVCVRDLQPDFPGVAYTTLMTTLDRLFRKGLLGRIKDGRAFRYQARYSKDALISERARRAIVRVLDGRPDALGPVLSTLIETVTAHDEAALDELERLVQARRKQGGRT